MKQEEEKLTMENYSISLNLMQDQRLVGVEDALAKYLTLFGLLIYEAVTRAQLHRE